MYPSNYDSNCCSTFSAAFPLFTSGSRGNLTRGPWDSLPRKKRKCFHAWVSGACITISSVSSRPGPCLLDLKWSSLEASARSCGFPLTLMPEVMPWEPCNIICFPCHLIVLANGLYCFYQSIQIDFTSSHPCSSTGQ